MSPHGHAAVYDAPSECLRVGSDPEAYVCLPVLGKSRAAARGQRGSGGGVAGSVGAFSVVSRVWAGLVL